MKTTLKERRESEKRRKRLLEGKGKAWEESKRQERLAVFDIMWRGRSKDTKAFVSFFKSSDSSNMDK